MFVDGKPITTYSRVSTAEANKKLALKLKGTERPGKATVAAFLQDWLKAKQSALRPKTFERYEEVVTLHLSPKPFGSISLMRLSSKDVQKLIDSKRATLAPRSVRQVRVVLVNALNHAVRQRLIDDNPAAGRKVILPRISDTRPKLWDFTQLDTFLSAVTGDRWEALYKVGAMLGLRQGELLGLCWSDVDFKRRNLNVRRELQRNGKFELVDLKTARSRRSIPLPAVLVDVLQGHKARQGAAKLQGKKWNDNGWDLCFTTDKGSPIEARNLVRSYKQIIAEAGLPEIRFHDLRRMALSKLIATGGSVPLVQRVAGHANSATTLDIYADSPEAAIRDAIDKTWGAA